MTTAAMVMGGVSLVAAPASSAGTCPTLSGQYVPFTVTPAPTPGVDWSGCDLTGANLAGANLTGANLYGANLEYALLPGVNLTGANLTLVFLYGANLTDAFVACGTGGVLGASQVSGFPILPAGWTLVGGVLTVPVVACAAVALDVPAPVSVGVSVTVRATVTPATAAGSVEFLANGTSLGTAPVTGGVAMLPWVPTAPGTVTLVVKYVASDIPLGGVTGAGAAKVVTVGASVPGAPTGVSAAAGDAQARVSWTAPGSDGGSAVTGYVVQQSFDAGASWTVAPGSPVTGSTTSLLVKALANGVSVSFRVAAVNTVGTGPFSTPSSAVRPTAGAVTPPAPTTTPTTTTPTTSPTTSVTKPGRVAGLKAKSTGKRKVTLRWQAPSSGSAAVTYQYRVRSSTKWKTTTSTKATVKGRILKKGKRITFQVRALNSAGTGPAASKRIKITR